MANSGLAEAFSDCIDRLIAGQSIDECLATYPQYAAELRVLLETGSAVRRAAPPVPPGAKARVRAQVMQAANRLEYAPRRSSLPVSRLAMAAIFATAILVVVLVANLMRGDDERLQTAPIPSPTASATLESPTPSPVPASATSTPTRTSTLTQTPSPTRTPTPTSTPSPTQTPTRTASPSATPTACVVTTPGGWVQYSIQSGETLSAIAAARGVSAEELQRVNCLSNPNQLVPGQAILVPPIPSAAPAPAATSPPPPVQQAPPVSEPPAAPTSDDDGDDHGGDDDRSGDDDSGGDDGDDSDDNSGSGGGDDDTGDDD